LVGTKGDAKEPMMNCLVKTYVLPLFLVLTQYVIHSGVLANEYSTSDIENFAHIFSPPIDEVTVREFYSYGVRTSGDIEEVFNRLIDSKIYEDGEEITEYELLEFLEFEAEEKAEKTPFYTILPEKLTTEQIADFKSHQVISEKDYLNAWDRGLASKFIEPGASSSLDILMYLRHEEYLESKKKASRNSSLIKAPREIGPFELGMSIDNFLKAAGTTPVTCAEVWNDSDFERDTAKYLAKKGELYRCREEFFGINPIIKHGQTLRIDTVIGTRLLTTTTSELALDNELGKKLFNSIGGRISANFVDRRLQWISLSWPAVTSDYLTEKYGEPQVNNKMETRQCFNRDGFADTSQFGTFYLNWIDQKQKMSIAFTKSYSEGRGHRFESCRVHHFSIFFNSITIASVMCNSIV